MTTIATQAPTPAGRDCAERHERASTVQLSRDAVAIWVFDYLVLILGLFGIVGMAIVLPYRPPQPGNRPGVQMSSPPNTAAADTAGIRAGGRMVARITALGAPRRPFAIRAT